MMKSYERSTLLVAACALTLAVSLSGCGGAAPSPERSVTGDGSGSENVESPTVTVGDCRLEGATALPADAEVVPCAEPHDEEVFHQIELTDATFSEEAIEAATLECIGDPFTAFVGVPREESALSVYLIPPTEETWDQPGGRVVSCVLVDPAGQVEGTLEGAAR
ncbi:MAG: hypothetical protein K0Q52_3268 [Microbacterium sp.]|nr:hypothetical protein [Microbacterium sp.]